MALIQSSSLIRGSIDAIDGQLLHGWIFGAISPVRPLLLVDNEPATLVTSSMARPDVCAAFGIKTEEKPGFIFRLPPARAGAALRLLGVTAKGVYNIAEKNLSHSVHENNLLIQLGRAASIAHNPETVGIVSWDGAHNAIGRAVALHDIISTHRPSVILCYIHDEFGPGLWPPLLGWDGAIITIPWKKRYYAHNLLNQYGIKFNTVWISKPRLPSFMLAKAVAHENTRIMLDIDDEEDAFYCSSATSCYDTPGANLSHFMADQITARTVSGPMLQAKYGGTIVRHARSPRTITRHQHGDPIRIAFIGTARPHKNLIAIARALNILSASEHLRLHFHIYGEILPPEYRTELENAGAIIHGFSQFSDIGDILEETDVLLCGFPHVGREEANDIVRYQVPAKISDALAAGVPILVPANDAVSDLGDIPGIYLFDELTFHTQLLAALHRQSPIYMPWDFTPEGAYEAFRSVEEKAQSLAWSASAQANNIQLHKESALVLIWKQNDAGFYGRRIDQVARSYKRSYPDRRVIILEFKREDPTLQEQSPEQAENGLIEADNFFDDLVELDEWLEHKKHGLTRDGILYRTIVWQSHTELQRELALFLEQQNLLPHNSQFVIYPVIEPLEAIEPLLRPYHKIADIVDNELGWAENNERRARLLEQYFRVMQAADSIVFNSAYARDFFIKNGFASTDKCQVIPNWYDLPEGIQIRRNKIHDGCLHIIYSGNMNDRIDWGLLQKLTELPNVKLHLAGTATRQLENINALIAAGAIYHGVLYEKDLIDLLFYMDMAIIAHKYDDISKYMDPLKLSMYKKTGLTTLCPHWLQTADANVMQYKDTSDALAMLGHTDAAFEPETAISHSGTEDRERMMRLLGLEQ